MRDPDLVFKAQVAASSLERAWQRWRVVHGLAADPMPAISSYVGYSLEEPWGQPRVVFGLAADDAEQLAALLDRHDCIGPVHAMVAARGGRELLSRADSLHGLPLPVPPQAPSVLAEQSAAERPGPPARQAVREGRPARPADRADDRDGPVFRQVAAAAQEAAAARADTRREGWESGEVGDSEPGEPDVAAAEFVAAADPGGIVVPGPESAVRGDHDADAGEARSDDDYLDEAAPDQAVDAAEDVAADVAAEARAEAAVRDTAGAGSASAHGVTDPGAGNWPDELAQEPHGDESGPRSEDAAGRAPRPPGPLALAAGAARAEAEARIRAALLESRSSAGFAYPYSGGSFDVTDPLQQIGVESAGSYGAFDTFGSAALQDPMSRPEAASGAQFWPAEEANVASAWGGPEFDAADAGEQAVVPFRLRPDLAAYLDAGPEPDQSLDERQDHSGASYTRRNRITRGYSIPRLSRTKRSGAVPGA